jgi:hypothetical protein
MCHKAAWGPPAAGNGVFGHVTNCCALDAPTLPLGEQGCHDPRSWVAAKGCICTDSSATLACPHLEPCRVRTRWFPLGERPGRVLRARGRQSHERLRVRTPVATRTAPLQLITSLLARAYPMRPLSGPTTAFAATVTSVTRHFIPTGASRRCTFPTHCFQAAPAAALHCMHRYTVMTAVATVPHHSLSSDSAQMTATTGQTTQSCS